MTAARYVQSRRDLLGLATAGAAALVMGPGVALATPEKVAEEIKKLFGDKKLNAGKIKLDLPTIAENGLVVPLNFEVESPMTEKDYVKSVHIFAEGNPKRRRRGVSFFDDGAQSRSLDPHSPCQNARDRRGRGDVEWRHLCGSQRGEGYNRRLRRLR